MQTVELQLLEEVQRRRVARQSLPEWCRTAGFAPAAHHLYVLGILEKIVKGEFPQRKVMILMPPGSAKSTYASVCFPPWYLAQQPKQAILACSHSHSLVEGFGRRCRNLVDMLGNMLGYTLAKDSQAAGEWAISNGGFYFCAGAGAGIAGHRADLGLIDDPIGSREDADSMLSRDKLWNWYNYDFLTRLKPGAMQVFVYTPWHQNDLGHRILERERDEWLVIRLPFYAEENDPLGRVKGERIWKEYLRDDQFPKVPRVAMALYQLRPTPEEGDFFSLKSLLGYEPQDLPEGCRRYIGSDHAVSLKQEADRTCIIPVAVDDKHNIYILPDVYWERAESNTAEEQMLVMTRRHKPLAWWAGKDHITGCIKPYMNIRMRQEGVFIPFHEITTKRDKRTNARSIRDWMELGKVFFPKFANWWPEAENELLCFDKGEHDDFVDALAIIGKGLDQLVRGDSPVVEPVEEFNVPFKPTGRWLKKQTAEEELHQLIRSLDH